MVRIGILTCSNATQDLGCSSVSCLADLRKRRGAFASYPADEPLDLVGIINCPGCPTLTGADKLMQRIRALTEFKIDAVHLSYCMKALCPFKEKYKSSLEEKFPNIKFVIGTHEEHITTDEFKKKVKDVFNQQRKTMVDIIFNR
jgi:predicted metal-binding protein